MEMDIAGVLFILERHLHNQRRVIKYNVDRCYIYRYCILRTIMAVDIAYKMEQKCSISEFVH